MSSPAATELIHVPKEDVQVVRAEDFMPVFAIEQAVARQKAMTAFIGQILRESTKEQSGDYGIIPGTKGKVLLKPGAEKLCTFFGLSPRFTAEAIIEDWSGKDNSGEPLFYYRYKCELYRGERFIAEAVGSCNSREKKYRYRSGQRVCPSCGQAALIQGKQFKPTDPKEWLCWAKKGGCGMKFAIDDPAISSQEIGQVINPDVADQVNAMQKIAQKRALVAAVLIGTNASDSFTQDIEEEEPPTTSQGGAATAPPISTPVESEKPATNGAADARPVPEELRLPFERIKESGGAKHLTGYLQDEMILAGGDIAKAEWQRRVDALTPEQKRSYSALKSFALDVWERIIFYRAEREKLEAYQATAADLPEGVFEK